MEHVRSSLKPIDITTQILTVMARQGRRVWPHIYHLKVALEDHNVRGTMRPLLARDLALGATTVVGCEDGCEWQLNLLGRFELRSRSQLVPKLGVKERALIAFLALQPTRTYDRVAIASHLWSEHCERDALANLRQVLVRIKRATGSVSEQALIVATRQSLRLQLAALDVEKLLNGSLELLGDKCFPNSIRCVLLQEFTAIDPVYDEWLASERYSVRKSMLSNLTRYLENARSLSCHHQCISIARIILEIEPFDETVHRVLLEALCSVGLFSQAASEYRALAEKLKRELQVEPDAKTCELFEALTKQNTPSRRAYERHSTKPTIVENSLEQHISQTIEIYRFDCSTHDAGLTVWTADFQNGLTEVVTNLCHVGILSACVRSQSENRVAVVAENSVGITGRVNLNGSMLAVSTQIFDCSKGTLLWEGSFDTPIKNSHYVVDEIVAGIAITVEQEHRSFQGLLVDRRLDKDYWMSLLRAWRLFSKFDNSSLKQACEQSARLVTDYPRAMGARQAYCYSLFHRVIVGDLGKTPDLSRLVINSAKDLVRLFPKDPRALSTLAMVLNDCAEQPQHAIDVACEALSLNPDCACSFAHMGDAYVMLGQSQRAIECEAKAVELDPLNPGRFFRYAAMASADFSSERWQSAQHWARRSLDLKPDYIVPLAINAAASAFDGGTDGAEAHTNERMQNGQQTIAETQSLFRGAELKKFSAGLRLAGW